MMKKQRVNFFYNKNPVSKYYLTNTLSIESKTIIAYALALFMVPLLPLHQLVVGTIVNSLLIHSAITQKTNKILVLAFIPSIAVATGGILFSGLTNTILVMLPFIWIGNLLLMWIMRKRVVQYKKEYLASSLLASTTKTGLLFGATIILFYQGALPVIFLTSFGITQFFTAMAGSIIVLVERKLIGIVSH